MHGDKPAVPKVSTLTTMSGDFELAHFLTASVPPEDLRALLAVVLVVRLDRYQAAITCPIATSDSFRKGKERTIAGFLLCGSERV